MLKHSSFLVNQNFNFFNVKKTFVLQIIKVTNDGGGNSPPDLMWGTPINSMVLEGETLKLKCIYSGKA
jgi:hypothetical protein